MCVLVGGCWWGLFLEHGVGRLHFAGRNPGEEGGGKAVLRVGGNLLFGWKSGGSKVCMS